jgi:hypothetical protein
MTLELSMDMVLPRGRCVVGRSAIAFASIAAGSVTHRLARRVRL